MADRDWGSKPGSGGVASAQNAAIDRRNRLRQLAMETIDLSKDPYFMRNHLGTYECKLCLTLHNNEGNYLAHTQGKRHKENVARRAAKAAAEQGESGGVPHSSFGAQQRKKAPVKARIKIGRPGYTVTKLKDPETGEKSLRFDIDYPEIEEGLQPRHSFMSAFEQRLEAPDKRFQYLLFAAAPYETVGFKVPNWRIVKDFDKKNALSTEWDEDNKRFTLHLTFEKEQQETTS